MTSAPPPPPGSTLEVLRTPLRRRLGTLVLRDALDAYGVGMALVLLPMVYLFREWPPWDIRDALRGLPPAERALVLAALHGAYGLATAPVVRTLLASNRLRWWWALPLPARWWRALHVRHLVLLDAPWLLAIVYGVLPSANTEGPIAAATGGLAFILITLAGQITLVRVADRPAPWTLAMLALWAAAVAAAVLTPGPLALVLAVLSFVPAAHRLGQPMPETGARARGHTGGTPVLALARMQWLAVRRNDGLALLWGGATQLAAVALVGLAIVHVGEQEPSAAAALRRGLAVVCAATGAAVVLSATRRLDGDRPLIDTWGIAEPQERRARLLLAAAGVLPALAVGTLVLPMLGPVGRPWPVDLLLATAWAVPYTVRLTFSLEAQRRLHQSRLPRQLLVLGAALMLTGFVTTAALLVWASIELWRIPSAQRRADRARQRFETARRDDHRGSS